jgi:hypothetical protein
MPNCRLATDARLLVNGSLGLSREGTRACAGRPSDLARRPVRPATKCAPEIRGVAESQRQGDFLVSKLRGAKIFQRDLRAEFI